MHCIRFQKMLILITLLKYRIIMIIVYDILELSQKTYFRLGTQMLQEVYIEELTRFSQCLMQKLVLLTFEVCINHFHIEYLFIVLFQKFPEGQCLNKNKRHLLYVSFLGKPDLDVLYRVT